MDRSVDFQSITVECHWSSLAVPLSQPPTLLASPRFVQEATTTATVVGGASKDYPGRSPCPDCLTITRRRWSDYPNGLA